MALREDEAGGLEGLPLMMIIVIVVVAFVVAGIFSYWGTSDAQRTEADLRSSLGALAADVQEVSDPSFNGSTSHVLLLREGASTKIRWVAIGGVLNAPERTDLSLRYLLSSGQAGTVTTGGVRVTGEGGTLELQPGQHPLRLEQRVSPDAAIGRYVYISEA